MNSHASLIALVLASFLVLFLLFRVFKRKGKPGSANRSGFVNEQVYVGNLAYRVTENDLTEYFSQFGELDKVKVIRHFETGRSKGYAFVTYFTSNEANKALRAHGQDLHGRAMVVRIAKPKQHQDAR